MKTHTRITAKQTLFAAIFLFAFLLLTIFLFTYRRNEQLFTRISTRLFQEEMAGNTLNMHYNLAYPVNFGIYDYDVVLPCYSQEGRLISQAETENTLALLRSLNPSRLSENDQYTRRLLLHSLDTSLSMSSYVYFDEPLSPSSGMQSQLPILLAEYTFRTRQDVEDYLKLLDQTDEYFASLLVFEQEKAAAGLLQPTVSLEKVRKQCDSILTQEELDAGNHFLQTTFRERLEELYSSGKITKDEAQLYLSQNNRLLKTVMLPAYEALSDGLFVLEDDAIILAGLAAKPQGADYYECLLRSQTGSSRPIEEVKEMLSAMFSQEYQTIRTIAAQHPALLDLSYQEELEFSFPYHTASQMLIDLQERMQPDFPSFAEAAADNSQTSALPSVSVKTVSASLQDYCAPAFYLTPPLDDTTANVIYINEKSTPSGLDLYTTLAHEGYPGHMYQSVFSNRIQFQNEKNYVRQVLWYGGYLEGWALYVEFRSFDFASDLMEEQEKPELAAAIQLEKHNRSLQLCLYSLLDIMIHYDNASYDQVAKVLNAFGITNAASVSTIYEYIVEEPANYLKYYLGYLEILALQEKAKSLWGETYSDYAFHTFFLKCGPSDFSTLNDCLTNEKAPEEPAAAKLPDFAARSLPAAVPPKILTNLFCRSFDAEYRNMASIY